MPCRGGLIGPRHWQGKQGLFGLPWALCGLGGFSPLATLRLHPLEVYFLVPLGGGADWIAADIAFRRSPLTRWTFLLTEVGLLEGHCLQVYLPDWLFRIKVLRPCFDVLLPSCGRLPVILGFSGLPAEAGIPPGSYPRP